MAPKQAAVGEYCYRLVLFMVRVYLAVVLSTLFVRFGWCLESLEYKISEIDKGSLIVEVKIIGGAGGETALLVPSGLCDFYEEVVSFSGDDRRMYHVKDGKLFFLSNTCHYQLDITQFPGAKFKISGDSAKVNGIDLMVLKLKHIPKAKFNITYRINMQQNTLLFRKIKGGGTILISGSDLLVTPYDNKPYNITINFLGKDMSTSHDSVRMLVNKNGFFNLDESVTMTSEDLRNSGFIVGAEMKLLDRMTFYEDSTLDVFLLGNRSNFIDGSLLEKVKKIVQSQCAVFNCQKYKNDLHKKYFLFFINSAGNTIQNQGYHFRNINIVDLYGLDKGSIAELYRVIAHENLHNFMGVADVMHLDDPDTFHNGWFNEGFVDYLASYLNLKDGIVSMEQHIAFINDWLAKYHRLFKPLVESEHPFHKTTAKARTIYMSDPDLKNEARYMQGNLLALDLDYILEKKSSGKLHFDDLVRQLLAMKCDNLSCVVTVRDIEDALSLLLYGETVKQLKGKRLGIAPYFENYVRFGAMLNLDFPSKIFNDMAVLTYRKSQVYDIGFDSATMIKGIAHLVDKKGNAYRAGLRDGDRLINFNLNFNFAKFLNNAKGMSDNSVKGVTTTVIDSSGKEKEITYMPISEKEIPQYTMSH